MNLHELMISTVADAMGDELLERVAFVGGCATGLLVTDPFSKEQVRHTDDVDLIINVVGRVEWHRMQSTLHELGFRPDMGSDDPICAMRLGELRVDFMPDDENILGFTNRWYSEALKDAMDVTLPNGRRIRLVSPVYFIATKLEAYFGRGKGDVLGSRDVEDILTLVDGRPELMGEVADSPSSLKEYISKSLLKIMEDSQFSYAVTSAAGGDDGREALIFQRLEALAQGANP